MKVIFACVHSAGRSQIAAAFFNKFANGQHTAVAAGTEPAERVHPEVVACMTEVGFDLSAAKPRLLTEDLTLTADWLITMGCGAQCPAVPSLKHQDWLVADPKGRSESEIRQIRDDIRARVQLFLAAQGVIT